MDPLLLVKAMRAIMPEITLNEFQSRLAIVSRSVSKQVMQYLLDNGIGRTSQNIYMFSNSDRIKLAILALTNGNDVELISKILTWRDFEVLTSEILNLSDIKLSVM